MLTGFSFIRRRCGNSVHDCDNGRGRVLAYDLRVQLSSRALGDIN